MEGGIKKLRKQLGLYLFAMLALIVSNIFIWNNFNDSGTYLNRLAGNVTTIASINSLVSTVKEAESGVRGFVITGNKTYLAPYRNAKITLEGEFNDLKSSLNSKAQRRRIFELEKVVKRRLERLDTIISQYGASGQKAVQEMMTEGTGLQDMGHIKSLSGEIRTYAYEQNDWLNDAAKSGTRKAIISFVVSSAIITALFIFVFISTYRMLSQQIARSRVISDQAELSERVAEEFDSLEDICEHIISFLAPKVDSLLGSFYINDHSGVSEAGEKIKLKLFATYGAQKDSFPAEIGLGEGILGEGVKKNRVEVVKDLPENYPQLSSSLGSSLPKNVIAVPLFYEGEALGIIELGSLYDFSKDKLEYLESMRESIAVSLSSALARNEVKVALQETKRFAAQLQEQREELRTANEELEEKTEALSASKERLQTQQEELRVINEELEEQTERLEVQKEQLESSNLRLKKAQEESFAFAEEAKKANRYKSEFLANMSHELRTPLNSLLILSDLLKNNKDGNLNEQEIEYASTIHRAGNDLLDLINDILDLSKVEAGKMSLDINAFTLGEIEEELGQMFAPIAKNNGIEFISENPSPEVSLEGDKKRLMQIVKNFLSNAMKFTEKGSVKLSFKELSKDELHHSPLKDKMGGVAISVEDTGIGIPKEQQEHVFQAFQQIDGSLSRRFSGTGLGLTISNQMAELIEGDIALESEEGKGSKFTLYAPLKIESKEGLAPLPSFDSERPRRKAATEKAEEKLESLKSFSKKDGKTILIVEDDLSFAKVLLKKAQEFDFDPVHAPTAKKAFELIKDSLPVGVLLDVELPDESGLTILRKLKSDRKTRSIPIHMISSHNFSPMALSEGAVGYFEKPINEEQMNEVFKKIEMIRSKEVKRVLVVEDDDIQRQSVCALLNARASVNCEVAATGEEALKKLNEGEIDCVILDLNLPDMSGTDLLETLEKADKNYPPVVVYTGKDLGRREEERIRRFSDSIIVKGARSPERLLDEVGLFLHEVYDGNSDNIKQSAKEFIASSERLKDKRILIVDDDMRNVFSLTAALEQQGAEITVARNGQEALDRLKEDPDQDAVLMDIMMPVMDGLEAIQKIRGELDLSDLPIIALTAKAMKNDREECLSAGANDYMAKPVNIEKLVGLLKVWLPHGEFRSRY